MKVSKKMVICDRCEQIAWGPRKRINIYKGNLKRPRYILDLCDDCKKEFDSLFTEYMERKIDVKTII